MNGSNIATVAGLAQLVEHVICKETNIIDFQIVTGEKAKMVT